MVKEVTSRDEVVLSQAQTADDIDVARGLFKEYEAALGISLCFQNFAAEVANLPGSYAPPAGRLLIARVGDFVAGCIALRKISADVCEMKRLYLRTDFRGRGIGRVLVDAVLSEAKQIGYSRMRLDTIRGRMDPAIALYRSIGFKEVAPYYESSVPETLYMELVLTAS